MAYRVAVIAVADGLVDDDLEDIRWIV